MRVLLIDGYSDEPGGLGVPPYLDVYPRYIYGAIKAASPGALIEYLTIDQARADPSYVERVASKTDLAILSAGVSVPGNYLSGRPAGFRDIVWFSRLRARVKVLAGPVARFGVSLGGGRRLVMPRHFTDMFDLVITGDPEVVVYQLVRSRLRVDRVNPRLLRGGYEEIEEFILRGTEVVLQHPNLGKNLVVELETYRGCPRSLVGGCSFCADVRWGLPRFRDQRSIVREVELLYNYGVRALRFGRQPDFFAYKAEGVGEVEFPRPRPEEIGLLLRGVRRVAPNLATLHIDNVNPGTVYHHPEESVKVAKIIIQYHTPGDVAAFGVETADEKVVKANNLKVMPDEAIEAVRLLNRVGGVRGYNGLPHLLPGINFVIGLMGETEETFRLNMEFLRRLVEERLVVRRINIRQVMPVPGTPMWSFGTKLVKRHKDLFRRFKESVRREIDSVMLRWTAPRFSVIRGVYVEQPVGKGVYGRQPASYPLLIYIPERLELGRYIDVVVVDHGYRSIVALPKPISINRVGRRQLASIPGITDSVARKILLERPFKNPRDLRLKDVKIPRGLLTHLDYST